jgi:outer membrane protein
MKKSKLLIFLLVSLSSVSLLANTKRVSLKEAINFSLKHNAEVAELSYKIDAAKAERDKISGNFRPKIEALVGVGPMYEVSGNSLSSSTSSDNIGVTYRGEITAQTPIYTWGRNGLYKNAAGAAIEISKQSASLKKLEIVKQVKEAYFGYLFALSLVDYLKETRKDLEKILKDLKKKKKKTESYQIKILISEVDVKMAELHKGLMLAKSGLKFRLGDTSTDEVIPLEDWIDYESQEIESLKHYISLGERNRPEFKQLELGINAKSSLLKAKKLSRLPTLAAMASYEFATTSGSEEQQSEFAYDPHNKSDFSVGVGVKWNLDFGITSGEISKLKAEKRELESKRLYANHGIKVEIEKAWLEVNEAITKLKAYKKAYKNGKRWFTKVSVGLGLGLGDSKKMSDAYQAKVLTMGKYYDAIYNYQLKIANLSYACGIEVDKTIK